MKTRNWLWLLLAAMVCMFGACDDNSPSTPPEWAVNGGSISLTPSGHELSRDEAWELVKEMVLCDNLKGIEVRLYENRIKANDSIKVMGWQIEGKLATPSFESWLIFIDDNPLALWSHNCRYVFVEINGSCINVVKCQLPPISDTNLGDFSLVQSNKSTNIPTENKTIELKKSRNASTSFVNELSASKSYAVIINGGGDYQSNNCSFWNSCASLYTILTSKYGFLKSNMRVLITDGGDPGYDRKLSNNTYDSSPTDLNGDNEGDVTSGATFTEVKNTFEELASILTSEDELIIFINDHGNGTDSYCYTVLWNNDILTDYQLNSFLSSITAKNIHVIISSCKSGPFISTLNAANRTIATSCDVNEDSYILSNGQYSIFMYAWLAAMNGSFVDNGNIVNKDVNYDGIISYTEAFNYAYTYVNDIKGEQHPQYSSTPTSLGLTRGLKPESLYAINGDSRFCSQAVYNIPGLPSGANVEWNVTYSEKNPNNDSQLSHSSFTSTGSTLTLSRTAPATYNIGARITYNGLTEDISKKASCGACSPYNGIMYWESDLLNGSVQFNYNTGGPEFEVDVAQDFVVTSYVDFAGNVIVPTIDYILSPDITHDDCSGNKSSLTFGFSGEGEMEVYLLNDCGNNGTEYSFIVPYIVFDPNSYSLQLDESTSTLNIASQTTTYGLRNENPIRTIEVRTYDRQTLLTFNVEDDQTNVADIDISTLSPGTYILKVTDDTVHYLKLVI